MKEIIRKYRWHPLIWTLFAAYEIISLWTVHGLLADPKNYLVHYVINISLSYVASSAILPSALGGANRKYLMLFISAIGALITYLMISNLADKLLGYVSDADFFGSSGIDEIFIAATIWRGIYFLGIGTTIFLFQNRVTILKKSAALEKKASEDELHKSRQALELANARNAYLRSQINPHFMLSSLTYIHDMTRELSPGVAETVWYLSKLLRYALSSERGPEKICIATEIQQVENLLMLSRIKETQTYIEFNCQTEAEQAQIIPFVLLSLVENMLKHGDLSNPEHPGSITVQKQQGMLLIETQNLKSSGINDNGLHTGLSNITQRLAHTYHDLGRLSYSKNDKLYFRASVSIPFEKVDTKNPLNQI
ncbi:sensor histidine kinase [Pedobacter sp. UBA5917]|uniref:sensor histidine kinase n=1 Tax=Pedobacter sp. UBA5917 TaxID=1947061 RepID=UPI0025F8F7D8|nr:histidine kinase [Pedobacter sp. UBA5917]